MSYTTYIPPTEKRAANRMGYFHITHAVLGVFIKVLRLLLPILLLPISLNLILFDYLILLRIICNYIAP